MSKIGIHFSGAARHDGFKDYLRQAAQSGSPFAAVFSADQNIVPDVLEVSPATFTVFRHQLPHRDGARDDAVLGQGNPYAVGLGWFSQAAKTFIKNPGFGAYSCTNELNPNNPANHRWAALYWLGQMQAATDAGYTIVWGNFSAGCPDLDDWATYYGDCLRFSVQHKHILGLHEYGLKYGAMREAAPYLTRRYRFVHQAIVTAGLPCPRIIISECAPGSNVDRDLVSLAADLKWYDAVIAADIAEGIPIIGACLYQWGGDEGPLFAKAMPVITAHVIETPDDVAQGESVNLSVNIPAAHVDALLAFVSEHGGTSVVMS